MRLNPLTVYRESVQGSLRTAFSAQYPPQQTAVSFALGLFIIGLPNLGAGLFVIGALGYRMEWANPLALSASVVILNPVAKGGVYVASYALGTLLLGPTPATFSGELSLSIAGPVLARILVGNVILAGLFAVVGYLVALYGIRMYQ
jgi:uncharacterized protein (DUF2062 family)